jgi:hypothetical protein
MAVADWELQDALYAEPSQHNRAFDGLAVSANGLGLVGRHIRGMMDISRRAEPPFADIMPTPADAS